VGKAPGKYNLYLGASHSGDRLNAMYRENVGESEILEALWPVLERYARERATGEAFGDFVVRAGVVPLMRHGRDFQKEFLKQD
jgi:sulfite reductase (NADPH) hemoprotein beta-component